MRWNAISHPVDSVNSLYESARSLRYFARDSSLSGVTQTTHLSFDSALPPRIALQRSADMA